MARSRQAKAGRTAFETRTAGIESQAQQHQQAQQATWESQRAETATRMAELEGYVEQLSAQEEGPAQNLPESSPGEPELIRLKAELEACQRLLVTERAVWQAERDRMQGEWNELATEFERRLAQCEAGRGPPPDTVQVEEDDSIEAYMARLMERVGGKSQQARPPVDPAPRELPRHRSQEVVLPIARDTEESQPQPRERVAPRLPPPELSADLSAMRELAIQNTRAALEKHDRRTTLKFKLGKVILGVTGAGAAAAIYLTKGTAAASSRGLIVVSLAITLVWGAEWLAAVFYLFQQWRDKERFAAGRPSTPAAPERPDDDA